MCVCLCVCVCVCYFFIVLSCCHIKKKGVTSLKHIDSTQLAICSSVAVSDTSETQGQHQHCDDTRAS